MLVCSLLLCSRLRGALLPPHGPCCVGSKRDGSCPSKGHQQLTTLSRGSSQQLASSLVAATLALSCHHAAAATAPRLAPSNSSSALSSWHAVAQPHDHAVLSSPKRNSHDTAEQDTAMLKNNTVSKGIHAWLDTAIQLCSSPGGASTFGATATGKPQTPAAAACGIERSTADAPAAAVAGAVVADAAWTHILEAAGSPSSSPAVVSSRRGSSIDGDMADVASLPSDGSSETITPDIMLVEAPSASKAAQPISGIYGYGIGVPAAQHLQGPAGSHSDVAEAGVSAFGSSSNEIRNSNLQNAMQLQHAQNAVLSRTAQSMVVDSHYQADNNKDHNMAVRRIVGMGLDNAGMLGRNLPDSSSGSDWSMLSD